MSGIHPHGYPVSGFKFSWVSGILTIRCIPIVEMVFTQNGHDYSMLLVCSWTCKFFFSSVGVRYVNFRPPDQGSEVTYRKDYTTRILLTDFLQFSKTVNNRDCHQTSLRAYHLFLKIILDLRVERSEIIYITCCRLNYRVRQAGLDLHIKLRHFSAL